MIQIEKSFMRKYLLLAILLILAVILSACSPKTAEQPQVSDVTQELAEFTLEELAQYDGKDGREAYVAVDGVVYDVTRSSLWKGGEHNGFTAGRDLTEEIKNVSPHGVSKLNNIPVVGRIKE